MATPHSVTVAGKWMASGTRCLVVLTRIESSVSDGTDLV